MSIEPIWLTEARRHIGTREIKGPDHEPKILQWWKAIRRGGIKDDETPWCAAYVGACLEAVGLMSSRYESAKSYISWGQPIGAAALGAIAVFGRVGGGHVGFVVGKAPDGKLMVLGGNQNDEVNIRGFTRDRLIAFRWPLPVPLPAVAALPVLAVAEVSTNEA